MLKKLIEISYHIQNDFNLEFRYDYFDYWQILRSLAIVFVLIPFLPRLSSFLFQRKSLVSESWKRLYECHRCAPFRNSWRFMVYPLFRSAIVVDVEEVLTPNCLPINPIFPMKTK